MTVSGWIILLLGAAATTGFSYYTYFRREPAGRGRGVLTALRAIALIIILLLLVDPQIGTGGGRDREGARVILDASLSMAPRAQDTTIWRTAIQRASAAGSGPIIIADAVPRAIARDSLPAVVPTANDSRVLPAVQAAAEAGARRVVLITDGGITDAADVARWLPRLGVQLDVQQIDVPAAANRAIAEVEAPAWAESGKRAQLRVGVAARGQQGTNARVVVRQGNEVLATTDVVLPDDGRIASAALEFTAGGPPEGGLVRYDVAFEQPDAIPDDDIRSIYVYVSDEPAGVAIVSFLPDWEPRFLHPVLERTLGVPVRTFLRVPNGSYFRGGPALEAGTRVEESVVRSAVAQADLLVLHGVTENAPAWWRDVAGRARRLILFPADALAEPYAVSSPVEGDWYVSSDVPASPIAAYLQGLDLSEVPPLPLAFGTNADAGWTPLHLGRTRRGGNVPALLAQQIGQRRVAIALGSGYWRWAFRSGPSRELYDRVWGALAGWMVQDQPEVARAAVRPVQRVVPRGEPVRWLTPGLSPDSLQLRVSADTQTVLATTVRAQPGDTLRTDALPPGHYRYRARVFADGALAAEAEGAFTVESYSAEFLRPAADLSVLRATPASLTERARPGGRPLHTSPWPYVLLVLLLCAEWMLRRRWGLR